MNEKCNKYGELFSMADENVLLEHIKNCPDCALEHEKMQKVSKLIKEVSFAYRRQKQNQKRIISIAASFLVIPFAIFAIQYLNLNTLENNLIASNFQEYTFEEMGLPVDDYGLIMVDLDN